MGSTIACQIGIGLEALVGEGDFGGNSTGCCCSGRELEWVVIVGLRGFEQDSDSMGSGHGLGAGLSGANGEKENEGRPSGSRHNE